MEQPSTPDRPRYLHNDDHKVELYDTDAYRERTYEIGKSARADRLADVRLRSVELAFKVYKEDPAVFGLDEVLTLADRIAKFVADGERVQDGADSFRFYGRK
jgi:hypothetical protein